MTGPNMPAHMPPCVDVKMPLRVDGTDPKLITSLTRAADVFRTANPLGPRRVTAAVQTSFALSPAVTS